MILRGTKIDLSGLSTIKKHMIVTSYAIGRRMPDSLKASYYAKGFNGDIHALTGSEFVRWDGEKITIEPECFTMAHIKPSTLQDLSMGDILVFDVEESTEKAIQEGEYVWVDVDRAITSIVRHISEQHIYILGADDREPDVLNRNSSAMFY